MIEHEGDGRGVETGVERIEHPAAHWDAIVALEHGRSVGEDSGDRVATPDASSDERRREFTRTLRKFTIVSPQGAMHDRRALRKNLGGSLEQAQRRQRLEIGCVAVEIEVIGVHGRGALFWKSSPILAAETAQANSFGRQRRWPAYYKRRKF